MENVLKKILDNKVKLHWIPWLKWLFGLIIFAFILLDGKNLFKEIHFGEAVRLIRQLPNSLLLIYALLGFLAVSMVSLYDFVWFHFNPREIKKKEVFRTAFTANAINNLVGIGGLGGAIIRTFFYRNAKVDDKDLIKINVLLVPSFFTGLGALMLFNIFRCKDIKEITSIYPAIYGIMIFFGVYLIIYLLSEYIKIPIIKNKFEKWGFIGSMKLKLSLISASTFDWLAATTFIWFIGNQINQNLSFADTIFFFSIAVAIGVISPIPAGIGIFDVIMIIGFRKLGLSGTESAEVIILYRIFYYMLPFIAAIFLTIYELSSKGNGLKKINIISPVFLFIEKKIGLTQNQLDTIKDITAVLLWILMLIASTVMITSVILPSVAERIYLIEPILSMSILQFSQRTALLLGLLLLVLSDEIRLRIKRAYFVSMVFLIFGSIFTLFKGFNIEETVILVIITIIFGYTKNHFYRISTPFSWLRIISKMILIQGIISLYILSGQTTGFSFNQLHKGIELLYLTPDDYLNNGIVLSILVQSFIIFWNLFWNFMPSSLPPWFSQTKSFVFEKLDLFLQRYSGTVLTHLVYSGDKYIYVSDSNTALIAFRPFGDKLIVLGDPIGKIENMVEVLDEFRHYADLYGYFPVYYQVSEEYLPDYHEVGYTFFKLGEEAIVDLDTFSLSSPNGRGFRSTYNRFQREGWNFKISDPPHSTILLDKLKNISTEWLNERKEKGFSLGRFDPIYLNRAPIAVISSAEGELVAFASIMPVYQDKKISVDLMRFSSKAPSGTMDYLFLMLFSWAKEQGYSHFYLGMAPLSNVGISRYAKKEEKAAQLIYRRTKARYNFKGLRQYKDKFHPQWQSKYLAYPTQTRVEPMLVSISVMIASSHKEILKP